MYFKRKVDLLHQLVTHLFSKNFVKFFGYEYHDFQFSKHERYAQRLCISNFQFYCFKKTYKSIA